MKIVIYGAGKQAELTHYFFTHDSPHEVVAFCVGVAYLPAPNTRLLGLPVVPFEELSTWYPPTDYCLHIAVGQPKARQVLFEAAKAAGYGFASYVSSRANTWPDLITGEHVFIDPSMVIHPYVTIGSNVLLIGCIIGHHGLVGSHVLASGCTTGGNVAIGSGTFVGIGAIINENVRIGVGNIIGSGALISRNTDDYAIYTGQPSKKRMADASRLRLFK